MELNDYMIVGVCIIAALLLFFRMAKENKVFIGAGILCLCYGGYHVAQALLDNGVVTTLGWILRGVAVVMLIWMFTVFSEERAKTKAAQAENSESGEETSEEEITEENDAE